MVSLLLSGKTLICITFFFLRTFIFTKQNLLYLGKCPKTDLVALSLPSYDLYILLLKFDSEVEYTVFHDGVGKADNADGLHFTRVQTGTVLLLPLEMWIFFSSLCVKKITKNACMP